MVNQAPKFEFNQTLEGLTAGIVVTDIADHDTKIKEFEAKKRERNATMMNNQSNLNDTLANAALSQ